MFPLSFLRDLVQDIRFQTLAGLLVFVGWAWRPRRMRDARNKTVLITGCDSGLGYRIAKRFDEMGMHVFAGCLKPTGKGALELKEMCSDRLHIVPLDITSVEQIQEAKAYVRANIPEGQKGLYGLVNTVGFLVYTDLDLMIPKMFEEIININLTGTMLVTNFFLPYIRQAQGRVVTITSILSRLAYPGTAVYAATERALIAHLSGLRMEMQKHGVHVAEVVPGDFSIITDIMQKWTPSYLDEIWNSLSPEDQESQLHLFEEAKKKVAKTKCSEAEQERSYGFILHDVEDAMLAEKPHRRYVSASRARRIAFWIFRFIPAEWTYKLMGEKAISN